MNDVSANSYLTKALEDSLNRLYTLKPHLIEASDLDHIKTIINRIAPNYNCLGVYFDNSRYDGSSAIPTYGEIANIGRYLFNFNEKDYKYIPKDYYLTISPKISYTTVREVVAEILTAIDNFACPMKFKVLKAKLLDKAIETGILAGDRVFTFKNGLMYNTTCTPLIVPLIVHIVETGKMCMNPETAIKYLTDDEISDSKKESLLVQYGYTNDLRTFTNNPSIRNEREEDITASALFNNVWFNLQTYPANKGKLIKDYESVLYNNTSGTYEKELAKSCISALNSGNNAVFDKEFAESNLQESVKTFFELKKKGFSYLEIDELKVEIEAMSNTDPTDKMYLITRIHKDINVAQNALHSKKNLSPNEREEIENFIVELRKLLDITQNKKVKDMTDGGYRIIVEYPDNDFEKR